MAATFAATYSGLKTAIEEYVEDDSTEFQSNFQDMMSRAEDECLRALNLSIWNKSSTGSTAIGVNTLSKPTGADLVHNLRNTTSGVFLRRKSYDWIREYGGSGAPLYFYEEETGSGKFYLAPTPDAVYTITTRYLSRPTRLSTSNETNWLSNHAGGALLYAALVEAEHFLIDPSRIGEFREEYMSKINQLRNQYRHLLQGGYDVLEPAPGGAG